jgi:hypothetical protein
MRDQPFAIFFSEMSVQTRSKRRHNPEGDILHGHRSKNHKSYTSDTSLKWSGHGCFSTGGHIKPDSIAVP